MNVTTGNRSLINMKICSRALPASKFQPEKPLRLITRLLLTLLLKRRKARRKLYRKEGVGSGEWGKKKRISRVEFAPFLPTPSYKSLTLLNAVSIMRPAFCKPSNTTGEF